MAKIKKVERIEEEGLLPILKVTYEDSGKTKIHLFEGPEWEKEDKWIEEFKKVRKQEKEAKEIPVIKPKITEVKKFEDLEV